MPHQTPRPGQDPDATQPSEADPDEQMDPAGFLTINDVREAEGLPPLEQTDEQEGED